jgi:FixJ family two-component response regulator
MATAGCSAEIPLLVIADDDASTRISTQRLIRSFGFRTEVFTSAQEFLESGCVQEIVGLPSGSNHIRIRICKRPGQKRKPRRQGAVDFLRKPVAEQALVSAIRTALLCKAPRERYIGRTLNQVDELVRQNLAKAWTQNSI